MSGRGQTTSDRRSAPRSAGTAAVPSPSGRWARSGSSPSRSCSSAGPATARPRAGSRVSRAAAGRWRGGHPAAVAILTSRAAAPSRAAVQARRGRDHRRRRRRPRGRGHGRPAPRSFALVLLMLPFLEAALWFGLSGLAGLWTISSVALGAYVVVFPESAADDALSVLVIAMPTLLLATPVAMLAEHLVAQVGQLGTAREAADDRARLLGDLVRHHRGDLPARPRRRPGSAGVGRRAARRHGGRRHRQRRHGPVGTADSADAPEPATNDDDEERGPFSSAASWSSPAATRTRSPPASPAPPRRWPDASRRSSSSSPRPASVSPTPSSCTSWSGSSRPTRTRPRATSSPAC